MRVFLMLSLAVAIASVAAPAGTQTLALTHATVIDPSVATAAQDTTIVVTDGRITRVGPSSRVEPPAGAREVDLRGRFVIPGLWDAHVHLSWTGRSALPVLVANGVTAVRDLGGRLSEIDEWRTKIAAGVMVGPRIYRAGPILNGQKFNAYQMLIGPPEEARGVARALKEAGVDFLKVHRRTPRDSFFALMDEARKQGLPVVGHVPMSVTPLEAAEAGLATLEHVETLFEGTFSAGLKGAPLGDAIRDFRTEGLGSLAAALAKRGSRLTPTLVAYRSILELTDPARPAASTDPRYRYVARSQFRELEKMPRPSPEEREQFRAVFEQLRAVAGGLHAAGVELLAGTDAAGPRVPGFPLHDELALLVEAGMSPQQALAAATSRVAAVVGARDAGSVGPGQLADLVVLDANPLEDISNTRRIHAVLLAGRLLDRAALDALLQEGETLAAGS